MNYTIQAKNTSFTTKIKQPCDTVVQFFTGGKFSIISCENPSFCCLLRTRDITHLDAYIICRHMPNLEVLDLHGCSLSNEDSLLDICTLKNLRRLNITGTNIMFNTFSLDSRHVCMENLTHLSVDMEEKDMGLSEIHTVAPRLARSAESGRVLTTHDMQCLGELEDLEWFDCLTSNVDFKDLDMMGVKFMKLVSMARFDYANALLESTRKVFPRAGKFLDRLVEMNH